MGVHIIRKVATVTLAGLVLEAGDGDGLVSVE
jgi:hypothetical protein